MCMPNKILMRKILKLQQKKLSGLEQHKEQQDSKTLEEINGTNQRESQVKDIPSTVETIVNLPGTPSFQRTNDTSFLTLNEKVCENILKAIKDMGFTNMTEIQQKCIPALLTGTNLVCTAKTGSGKTLAFLIPAIELICCTLKFRQLNGTGCIIISPTRELCLQLYGVLNQLMKYHHRHTYGLLMGSANRQEEARRLQKGVNIIVATSGRLLDHLKNTPDFIYRNVFCLVIDEADHLLDIGYEKELKEILNMLSKPADRQTMLFSATQTEKIARITALAMEEYTYVGIDDENEKATVESLQQGYLECPSEKKFLVLFTFLKKSKKKKIMVFFSSRMSVQYHGHLLLNCLNLPVMSIHGKQEQKERMRTFYQFCNASSGVLLCTSLAARGLDISDVDWVLQYDPPSDSKEYLHRVGRTARGKGKAGQAMLILRSEELGFLDHLNEARIPMNEYEFAWHKIKVDLQLHLEEQISENYVLRQLAKEAYQSYVRAYDSHQLKQIFDIKTLDLAKVAKSFGFTVPPAMDIKIENKASRKRIGEANSSWAKRVKRAKTCHQIGKHEQDNQQFNR